jgi:Mg-chelatase subunit ChlD
MGFATPFGVLRRISSVPRLELPMTCPLARHSAARGVSFAAALAALIACSAVPGPQAHEWPSPAPNGAWHGQTPPRVDPGASWVGLRWAGPHVGAPQAPSAPHCARSPQPFEIGAGAPWDGMQQHRRRAGAAAERPAGALSDRVGSSTAAPAAVAPLAKSSADAAHAPAELRSEVPPGVQRPARPYSEPVSAGVVDDNADFGAYLAFRDRHARLPVRGRDVRERYALTVHDARGRPVPDATVSVFAGPTALPLWARTDAAGRAWLHPAAAAPGLAASLLEVQVHDGRSGARGAALLQRGQKDRLQVVLAEAWRAPSRPQLDIAFLIDATGSMADEIDKLKRSMRAVADQIARLPSRPDVCYGLVAYRDRGDAFFVRGADFTNDLGAFQHQLGALQADAGGDMPEALNEALHTAVHRLSWRGDGTARLVLLVADAPPHLDYGAPWYDNDAVAAQAKGIKLFAVGASGLDKVGEVVFRQLAQYTGGRFVFLTYANAADPGSGPGRETVHEVRNYSVETLDALIVRLVGEEMAAWPGA